MPSVLAVYSSLNGEQGHSTVLANRYIDSRKSNEDVVVTKVDVAQLALPHLTSEEMQAWMLSPDERSDEQKVLAERSDTLIQQLMDADEIVLAVPMYNFGIPSSLKAYFDRISRAGVTFRYTETGPIGLLQNKRATVFATRGGMYSGTEYDTQTSYLTNFLNFLGIQNIKFVYAEGLNVSEQQASESLASAEQKIIELSAEQVD